MESIVWLGIFLILLVLEIISLGLTTIWFAGGALAAFAATLLGANVIIQAVLFLAVSLVLLFVTRPIAVKYFNKNLTRTNVENVIGKTAKVSSRIDNVNSLGEAVLEGETWMARSENNEIIAEGTLVTVVAVEGVKLIVRV
ncbi:MAG: NfeD family protein [Lachnospiraceae bacterium]|nr:NfeD family protein [Lachnospiraceae bacterium]